MAGAARPQPFFCISSVHEPCFLQSGDDEGMSTSCAMMPGTAVKSAPDRKAENGSSSRTGPPARNGPRPRRGGPPPWPPRGWRRSWAGCASPGGRASRTRRRKLPAQKPSKWRWGTSGASRRAPSGAAGPQSPQPDPKGPPSTKPQSRMGKCIGQSILPTCGRWPVTMGSTKASARRVRPARHCGPEKSFWFSSVSSCDCAAEKQKGACQSACKPTADPSWRLFQKCGG